MCLVKYDIGNVEIKKPRPVATFRRMQLIRDKVISDTVIPKPPEYRVMHLYFITQYGLRVDDTPVETTLIPT